VANNNPERRSYQERDEVSIGLARKRLYHRCAAICFVVGGLFGAAAFLLPPPAGWSGNEPFAIAAQPYVTFFFIFLILAFVFFILYARR